MQHLPSHGIMGFLFPHLPKQLPQIQITSISSMVPAAAATGTLKGCASPVIASCDAEATMLSSATPPHYSAAMEINLVPHFDAACPALTETTPSRSSHSDSDGSSFSNASRSSSDLSDSSSCADSSESLCSYRCLRSLNQGNQAVFSLGLVHDGGVVCGGLTTLRSKVGAGAVKALLAVGDKLFSAHQDKKIRVWRLSKFNHAQHTLVATLPTFKDLVTESTSSKFSLKKKKARGSSVQHTEVVSALALGNGVMYSGSWDKTVKVWRLSDLKCLDSFVAHDDGVRAVAASKKTGLLYTASADSTIKVWKKEETLHRKGGRSYPRHSLVGLMNVSSGVNALALASDEHDASHGEVLYSASGEASISVWSRKNSKSQMEAVNSLSGHTQAVVCLATLRNLLCSGSTDETIRVWRREHGFFHHTCLAVLRGHTGPVKSVVLSPDKVGLCSIVSGSVDGLAKVWRLYSDQDQEPESSSSSSISDGDGDAPQWKLSTIKHALDEGAPFLRLAFDTLQC